MKEIIRFLVADVVKMQVNKDASKQIHTYMLPGHCGEDFQDRLVKVGPHVGRRTFGKQNERSAKCLCGRLLQKVVTPFGKAEDGKQSRSKR